MEHVVVDAGAMVTVSLLGASISQSQICGDDLVATDGTSKPNCSLKLKCLSKQQFT